VPRVTFVNEHRIVDAREGVTVAEVARSFGIALGGVCWIEPSERRALNGPTVMEALRGMRGWRRLPRYARVLGDLKVYSTPAASSREGVARPIDPPPSPVADPKAARKSIDAAPTAEFVRGHPEAIGHGSASRWPVPPESRPNAARPLPTEAPPALGAEEGEPPT
jgi:hypothetical protein